MKIRLATLEDSDDIFRWRNDPVSRSMFLSGKEISIVDHDNWFKASLDNPYRTLYIGLKDGEKFGISRFDSDRMSGINEVSINMNPDMRGRGLAIAFLEGSIKKFTLEQKETRFKAVIKQENVASEKCFLRCGFVQTCREGGLGIFHYDHTT